MLRHILRDALRAPQDEGDRMTGEESLPVFVTPDLMSAIYTVKCIKGPEYNARGPGSAPGSSPGLAGMTENGRDRPRFDLGSVNYFLHPPHVAFLFK